MLTVHLNTICCLLLVHNCVGLDISLKKLPEDALLNFTELASKYGHNSDQYHVTTEDGYILKLFRMRGNASKPILLMHGLFDSADTFLLRGNTSLGISLAAAGYDVWVGNCRGNKYARAHVSLDPDKDKKSFWDFSFHEFGVYDVPAMMDFILKETGQVKIPVIGHSQGNLIFYILGAERPEYNAKIELLIALNPIYYLKHVKQLSAVIVKVWPSISALLKTLGVEEMFRPDTAMSNITKIICTQRFGYDLCGKGILFPVVGKDYEELEKDFFSVVVGHYLAGTSRKDADHQLQLAIKDNISQFDYGGIGNLVKYGTLKPPVYDLQKVIMPIAMIAAKNDNISTLKDVEALKKKLSNIVHYQVLERNLTNHIDMVWGKNMKEYIFPVIFDLLQKHATISVR